MRKVFIPLAILLVCAFVVVGCSSGTATTTTPASTTPAVTTSSPATSTAPGTSAATTTKPATSTAASPTASATPAGNKYGGTLRIIEFPAPGAPLGAEWEGNSPPVYNTQQWAEERLMKEKLDGTMQPELAESWEVTSTGNDPNILLRLRKGVKFHDGSDWNAKALAWNLQKFKDGNMFGSTTNYWKSWDIIDDYTLRIHFSQYLNTLTRAWENYFMVSPTAFEKNGIEWMRVNMVGTAAFKQVSFTRDVSTILTRNPNYWQQGLPYFNDVQLLYVADELTREALMKSGGAEMLNGTARQAARFPTPEYTIISRPLACSMIAPDSKNADSPWFKAQVRQAAEYAIDKEAMAKALGFGYGSPAYQLSSTNTPAYDPSIETKARKFDLAKAKQLLTDAGYPAGFKTTLLLQPGGPPLDMAVYVQAAWSKIGIQVDIQTPEPSAFQGIYTGPLKTGQILMVNFGEWSNFNTSLNVFFPRSQGGFYMPSLMKPGGIAGWDATLTKSLTTPAPDPAVLKDIENQFFNEATIIPLMYGSSIFITKSGLKDTGLAKWGTANAWDYASTYMEK